MTSATVNHPTCVQVELSDSSGRPCPIQLNVTAALECDSEATSSSLPVTVVSLSNYEVPYTAVNRGQHKIHILANDIKINGSPFDVTVYPNPIQLGHPERVVIDLNKPCGVAFNTQGDMVVSEFHGNKLSTVHKRGQKIRRSSSYGESKTKMNCPRGIAIDAADNIYVCSKHKLQKFAGSGELVKSIGENKGKKEGEFNTPHGVTLHKDEAYVCDSENHRIQVFDLDLKFT